MNLTYANNLVARRNRDAADPRLKHLVDIADLINDEPTDAEIVAALAERFDMTPVEVVERLGRVDVMALREVVV